MKALLFNGAPEKKENSVSGTITKHLAEKLKERGIEPIIFNIAESGIPLFDFSLTRTPKAVEMMNLIFREADIHIWLSPLYHGSMTGVMKNCLDWLELSSRLPKPYLTGKKVGLVCWADGVQAMNGINAMDTVAKALRAWTLPYSVPIQRNQLHNEQGQITEDYNTRFEILLNLLLEGPDKN